MLSACVVGKLVKDPIFPPPTGPNSNFQGNIFVNKYTKYIFTSEFVYIMAALFVFCNYVLIILNLHIYEFEDLENGFQHLELWYPVTYVKARVNK